MAVAAPARRSQAQTAPAPPARSAPPEPKKRPRDRPRPGGPGRSGGAGNAAAAAAAPATAPKRKAPAKKRKTAAKGKASAARAAAGTAAPARKAAPRRKATAPPARTPRSPKRRTGARVIPIAAGTVGRTAVAVTQLPESGLIHRLTRGRAWIGVLGVLLIGIVGLNVVTLSFAASAGKVDERIQTLSRENSVLASLQAKKNGQAKINNEAKQLGLSTSMAVEPRIVTVGKGNVATAAKRLGAAATAAGIGAAGSEGEATANEGASGETSAGESGSGEAGTSGAESEEAAMAGLSQEEKNAIYEETLAREAAEAEGAVSSEVSYEQSVTEVPTE
jgi:hypothetical protein